MSQNEPEMGTNPQLRFRWATFQDRSWGCEAVWCKIGEDLNKGFIAVSLIFIFWIFLDNLTELDRKKLVNKDWGREFPMGCPWCSLWDFLLPRWEPAPAAPRKGWDRTGWRLGAQELPGWNSQWLRHPDTNTPCTCETALPPGRAAAQPRRTPGAGHHPASPSQPSQRHRRCPRRSPCSAGAFGSARCPQIPRKGRGGRWGGRCVCPGSPGPAAPGRDYISQGAAGRGPARCQRERCRLIAAAADERSPRAGGGAAGAAPPGPGRRPAHYARPGGWRWKVRAPRPLPAAPGVPPLSPPPGTHLRRGGAGPARRGERG